MRNKVLPHWHILGAGSIGCLWASKLLQSGFSCTVLLRPERLSQLPACSHNLILTENGETTSLPVLLESVGSSNQIENLLVTTKAFDALPAVQSVAAQLSPNATIVLLQNGLGSQQAIADAFPDLTVYAGSTTDGAWLEGTLKVQRAGHGKTWLGPISSKCKNTFGHLISLNDMDIEFTTDIHKKLQEKVAINSAINGLAALHNCKNGDLLHSDHLPTVTQLCKETENILAAAGYSAGMHLIDTVKHVLTITGENICSTLQDVRQQRQTELPWINGYLLKLAHRLKVDAHGHQNLMQSLAEQGIH